MKKAISVLLMSLMGLTGTYAWAGSAREDSLERLKLSTDVLKAIMAGERFALGILIDISDGRTRWSILCRIAHFEQTLSGHSDD